MNLLDSRSADSEVQRHVLQVSRNGVHPLGDDFDLERLNRRPALRENIHDVNGRACGKGRQKSVHWTRTGTAVSVEAGRRAAGTPRVEIVLTNPFRNYALWLAHLGPPFSIGARTAFPHSVQLPS
jgi:hypothetical protein